MGDKYDEDLELTLTKKAYRFELDGPGITEPAIVEVTFTGQVSQLKSSDGDGYRNEARYTPATKLITTGKGYSTGQIYRNVCRAVKSVLTFLT